MVDLVGVADLDASTLCRVFCLLHGKCIATNVMSSDHPLAIDPIPSFHEPYNASSCIVDCEGPPRALLEVHDATCIIV